MAEARLDQLVKGAPKAIATLPAVASSVASNPPSPALAASVRDSHKPIAPHPSDPLSTLPNAPPQIYLNLLILEASLRAQYVALRARRRQHTFFLLLLALWIAYFSWALFWRQREDGAGRGGSVYWVVDMYEKVSFLGGVILVIFLEVTGQLDRGVRWPRRWHGTTNRGLRTFNLKVVVLRGPWWKQVVSLLTVMLPHRSFFMAPSSSYRYVPVDMEKNIEDTNLAPRHVHRSSITRHREISGYREEDLAPGGDHVKLLLLPKHFSADFRQNWEVYRSEYWEAENTRRAELRRALRKQQLIRARAEGGWLWWLKARGLRLAFSQGGLPTSFVDGEKTHHYSSSKGEKDPHTSTPHRTRARDHVESNSRSSSISSNATNGTAEPDDREKRSTRTRRLSRTSGSSSSVRRSRRSASDAEEPEPLGVRRLRERTKETSDESDSTGTQGSEVPVSKRRLRSSDAEGTAEDIPEEDGDASLASAKHDGSLEIGDGGLS